MKQTFISRLALGCLMLMFCQISVSQAAQTTPGYRAPLANVSITQLSSALLRVTVTLNSKLPAAHAYNIGIFAGGLAVMSNCDNNYAQFNGCYFPNITTTSTITFLLIGDFADGWHTNRYAIIVALAAPSPTSSSGAGLGPIYTKDFAGIKAPIQSTATMEYFPFGRIAE